MILWAALAIGSAIGMGALSGAKTMVQKVEKLLGIALFVYGIVLIIGAVSGNTDPLRPLHFGRLGGKLSHNGELKFITVKTTADVKRELRIAKMKNQPTMLDFYADWCISCKQMELLTFGNPPVQKTLAHFRLLRADITKNDSQDKMLQQYFNVVAPPTILFFSSDGKEIENSRIIGEMPAKKFLQHLNQLDQP